MNALRWQAQSVIEAQLFGAAAALLAACEEAEQILVTQQRDGTTFEDVAEVLDTVRAAINAAGGKI